MATAPGFDNGTPPDVGAVYLCRGRDSVLPTTLTGTTTGGKAYTIAA